MKLTQEGIDNLTAEVESLQKERLITIEDVRKSREMGDLSENGYYKASKSRLRFIDGQIDRIESILKLATLIEKPHGNLIGLGSHITVRNDKSTQKYLLVDALEADPKLGKISYRSPLGQALMHKKQGDTVSISAPHGEITYHIDEVS